MKDLKYLSISLGEFGWRGLGGRFRPRFERCQWSEPKRSGVWYPSWCFYFGPLTVRWLVHFFDMQQFQSECVADESI